MTDSIPALIANLRADAGDYGRSQADPGDRPRDVLSWDQREVRAWQAAVALESLSAPSGDPDKLRANVAQMIRRNTIVPASVARTDAVAEQVITTLADGIVDLVLTHRCLSPVTREALANWLGQYRAQVTEHPIWVADWDASDDFLSRFSLPEPAEVEWGLSDSTLDSFPEPHFTTKSEENVRMNQRRGHPAIKVVSRTVTPWVPVEKGAEQ